LSIAAAAGHRPRRENRAEQQHHQREGGRAPPGSRDGAGSRGTRRYEAPPRHNP
jgi:hypothetical protein